VPADALAIGRGRQVAKDGWAKTFRDEKSAEKTSGKKPKGAV
jgi:bifunctional UDP-N-acetylglucosamine pyrophosphorylase/glucosamine-1-phosphate N-acetyltransferase